MGTGLKLLELDPADNNPAMFKLAEGPTLDVNKVELEVTVECPLALPDPPVKLRPLEGLPEEPGPGGRNPLLTALAIIFSLFDHLFSTFAAADFQSSSST